MNMTARMNRVSRWVALLSLGVAVVALTLLANAQDNKSQQLVAPQATGVDQLKAKAIEAIRLGQFSLTNDYLNQAAALSKDPLLIKMASWAKQFEDQRQGFLGERRREFEKESKNALLLIEKRKEAYALSHAAKAYLLAENKTDFRAEPWVSQLVTESKRLASQDEAAHQWLRCLWIYSQLSTIEPEVPEWKDQLKKATRHIRLMAMYVPDDLKKLQETDAKEREEAELLVNPTTRPTTKPADEDAENQNRTDWRETLRGVQMDMLAHALVNTHANYFREVSYRKMLIAGLNGLRAVLTTPALERAFPESELSNPAKRAEMLGVLDAFVAKAEKVKPNDEADLTQAMLRELKAANERIVRLPDPVLVSEFADGAFGALDPFSSIIWPSDWEEFQKTTKGEFSGVGIQIQTDEAGNLKVVSPLEDSPAYKAGIKPDWIVTHIEGKSARWLNLNQAVKKITGPPGTKVTLTIRDTAGNSKDYTLKRETIKVASVKGWIHLPRGGWDYMIDPEQKIGYVRLTNFSKTSSADLDRAIEDMIKAGAKGVIFDLRFNPGGLLNAATDVVNKFVDKGVIVSTKPDRADSPNPPNVLSASRGGEIKMPLIVLVNQYSASASEIVAGALKDHRRAMIVGERTFGKGSVQMLYPLGNYTAVLKLTTSHYYLPNGKCIHREENSKEWGVDPNVTVEMTPEQMRAAIDARQELDILRDPDQPASNKDSVAAADNANPKKKDPLASDAQLSAALLLMRLQLAGGDQFWAQASR